jgi:cellulose synthase/poly-beta-1,6-N-acetylglucosamine synthase-like glycosyltransferase
VLLSLFLTCVIALGVSTVLLLALGHRIPIASRILGALLAAAIAVGAGELAARLWQLPPGPVLAAEALLLVIALIVVSARSPWNPVGQVFYASLVSSALAYLAFAAWFTLFGGLSVIGALASGVLFVLELIALSLTCWYAFDSLDAGCRVRWSRVPSNPDPSYRPRVSLQIAAYNEPPDMLIETIRSVEAIDYPNFEVLVIDNNTRDEAVWRPVEEYCRDRPDVRFVHVDELPGYKAGALNLLLREHTAPDVELIGVVDADYLVDPSYLSSVVGYFSDPQLAFVQTPQDYREYEHDPYLRANYDAGEYFFTTSMPSRNERDSIIFAGTMGLLRRSVLDGLGGWAEWCITEDSETSLRMLRSGYSGLYVARSFGKGIMPLTFAALKSQRFRWCFGGIQILRRHLRSLLPWDRDPANHLSTGQRLDYLFGTLHWFNDLVYLGFTLVLLGTAAALITTGHVGIRPLLGAVVLLPSALIVSGLLRALWSLRHRTGIGWRRALLAFGNWLSLSWAGALACLQALFRTEGVFLRTPKTADDPSLASAVWAARSETALALSLWGAGIAVAWLRLATPFLLALFAWQGAVYASSTYMSVLNHRMKLPEDLERRRRTERKRERLAQRLPYYAGGAASVVAVAAVSALILFGGTHPGTPENPFTVPRSASAGQGPIAGVIAPAIGSTPTATVAPSASLTASPTPSVSASPTVTPTPTQSTTPSPSASP